MFNFFVNETDRIDGGFYIIDADYNHVKNVLRMKVGEQLLINCSNTNYLCEIVEFSSDAVKVKIVKENYLDTSLPIEIHLFQGLPKSDKMELIIQKAVELGVSSITPVEMKRSIIKLDKKGKESKTTRWQAIAESAAKQSKCVTVPKVNPVCTFKEALAKLNGMDLFLLPYENKDGMQATKTALNKLQRQMHVGVLIGPEGGFDDTEVSLAEQNNAEIISLGKKILRTETAAITSVAMLMLYAEMNL